MKHLIIIFSLLIGLPLTAQITINRSHIIVSGQKVIQAEDTGTRAIAASGTNMNWDYSNLAIHEIDSLHFGLPFWFEGHTNFPTSNLAYKSYLDDSTVNFLKVDDNELSVLGIYSFTDTSEEILRFSSRIIAFPSTFASNFNQTVTIKGDAISIGFDPDSTGPIPFIDSLRINFNRESKANVDGWGNMKTPLGTYPALKNTILQITSQSADMFTNGFWLSIPKSVLLLLNLPIPEPDSTYDVNFWTNDASVGFPLISYNYSPGESTSSNTQWLMSKPNASKLFSKSISNFNVYPIPTHDILQIDYSESNIIVSLFDLQGRQILSETTTVLSLKHLQDGIYLLQIKDAQTNQVIGIKKIIKS